MYLYRNGIRYLVKEDLSSVNKKQAIHEIIKAMDSLRLTDQQIDTFIPMRFVYVPKGLVAPDFVDKDSYPYLNTVITKQKAYGNQVEKLAYPGSIAIYKEVYGFLNQFRWVYTYDTSYEDVIKKQVGIPIYEKGEGRMLLVPDCFFGINYKTLLTEELLLEDITDPIVMACDFCKEEIQNAEENTKKMCDIINLETTIKEWDELIVSPAISPQTDFKEDLTSPVEDIIFDTLWVEDLPDMENVKEETDTGSWKIEE